MAAALLARGARGDREQAAFYLDNLRLAQAELGRGQTVGGEPIPGGMGVVAASSTIDTGYGFSYFPQLHVGATAWYLMASQRGNPMQLLKGRGRGLGAVY